jgi:hypothetical protein
MNIVRTQESPCNKGRENHLIVGCVGNIFNFRDTPDLRNALIHLNNRSERVTLMHWGKVGTGLEKHIQTLSNIKYLACKPVDRDILLNKLHDVDCFLLPTASDLIWEPTTSVFDYILFDKPVIFTGLHNNEAYCILQNTKTQIVESKQLINYDFKGYSGVPKSTDSLILYSRDFYLGKFLEVIEQNNIQKR